jgi:hypothetical protein
MSIQQPTTQQLTGPPPVAILRRLAFLIGLLVLLGVMLVAVLGGSYAVETYLLR